MMIFLLKHYQHLIMVWCPTATSSIGPILKVSCVFGVPETSTLVINSIVNMSSTYPVCQKKKKKKSTAVYTKHSIIRSSTSKHSIIRSFTCLAVDNIHSMSSIPLSSVDSIHCTYVIHTVISSRYHQGSPENTRAGNTIREIRGRPVITGKCSGKKAV